VRRDRGGGRTAPTIRSERVGWSERRRRIAMSDQESSRPMRTRHPMPRHVREALEESGQLDAYRDRPPYQRDDDIGWITRGKRQATQAKRLAQTLDELAAGDSINRAWLDGRPRDLEGLLHERDGAGARRGRPHGRRRRRHGEWRATWRTLLTWTRSRWMSSTSPCAAGAPASSIGSGRAGAPPEDSVRIP